MRVGDAASKPVRPAAEWQGSDGRTSSSEVRRGRVIDGPADGPRLQFGHDGLDIRPVPVLPKPSFACKPS